MNHEQLTSAPAGDQAIEVELGDEMSFDLNFLVHTLSRRIREARLRGVVELIPEMASLQVSYEPDEIGYADLVKEIEALYAGLGDLESLELPSRLYYVPVLYFDPWTRECVEDYRAKIAPKEDLDPDLQVRLNGLSDRAHLKRLHSGTEYWVAALGFWPGLCSLMPLDPRARLTAPKYNPPRTWTPKGTIGLGGAITCIYPDQTPGGYQIFARSPMPIWDRLQRLKAFKTSLALFNPGDRVRLVPVERDEYDEVAARVEDGSYEHSYVDYQRFSIRAYHDWLNGLAADEGERAAA
jgi:KipI family sensor histidine kinase inhibitor